MLIEDGADNRGHGEHHGDPVALDRVDDAARVEGAWEAERHQGSAVRPRVH